MQSIKRKIIDSILQIEGGYINDPSDSGGPTKFGITRAVARQFGYQGSMKDLPRTLAFEIYAEHYWNQVRADDLLLISEKVTEEVVDTGVNMGPSRAGKFFQRVLNVLNNNQALYGDLKVDGLIGVKTVSAFEVCFRAKGESVILLALNCLQGSYYIALAETHPRNERFILGWLKKKSCIMSEPITVQAVSARVDANKDRLDRHEVEHETIWKKLNKVENRLPTWSVLFIAFLTAIVGSLITALVGVLV